jgi:glycosyltransferase involved in cell wall biosynthesis
VLDLASGLVTAGHHVHIFYSEGRAEPSFVEALGMTGARFTAVPMSRSVGLGDFASARLLQEALEADGPFDVVHGHSSKAGALVRLMPRRLGARIYTPHAFRTMDLTVSRPAAAVYGSIERILAKLRTEALIAVSKVEYDHATRLGVPQRVMTLVRNGIEPKAHLSRSALRAELGCVEGAFLLGFVGRLTHQKAPERFIGVLELLLSQGVDVAGVMLGDGDMAADVQALIAQKGLAGRIRLHSRLAARRYMSCLDLLVVTSRYEAMPYTFLEALEAGTPIISTSVGGVDETIIPGETGYVVPQHDAVAAIAAYVAQLQGDRSQLAAMAGRCRAHASLFTVSGMTQETLQVYRGATGR